MWVAKAATILAPEKYESTKLRRTIDHALNKMLVMEISRQIIHWLVYVHVT